MSFKTCEQCDQSVGCYTAITYHKKILDKLDDGERLWLLWVLAKSNDCHMQLGGASVSDFAHTIMKLQESVALPRNDM